MVSLCTADAFSEFFGLSGSLDDSFKKSRAFYSLFIFQLLVALVVVLFPGVHLFKLAVTTQTINAIVLPFVFYFLIKLTSDSKIMGKLPTTHSRRPLPSPARL